MAEFDVNVTIADNALAYSKIQQVSTTDRILGRSSAGAGNIEEIPCTAAGRALLDDVDATAQRITLGLASGALVNVTPSFINYTGGSLATTSTSFADVHASAAFAGVAPGFYEIQFFGNYNAAATTTGARFALNGTVTQDFLNYMVSYATLAGDRSTANSTVFDGGPAAPSSLATTGNNFMMIGNINVTGTGDIVLRFATEVGGSAITLTGLNGFLRRVA